MFTIIFTAVHPNAPLAAYSVPGFVTEEAANAAVEKWVAACREQAKDGTSVINVGHKIVCLVVDNG